MCKHTYAHTPTHTECNFGSLPDELVVHVFGFLGIADRVRVRTVCKDWYRLGSDRSLWRVLDSGLPARPYPASRLARTAMARVDAWIGGAHVRVLRVCLASEPGDTRVADRLIDSPDNLFAYATRIHRRIAQRIKDKAR